jgi:hypothetical protein
MVYVRGLGGRRQEGLDVLLEMVRFFENVKIDN